jgi:hypothetical protein
MKEIEGDEGLEIGAEEKTARSIAQLLCVSASLR